MYSNSRVFFCLFVLKLALVEGPDFHGLFSWRCLVPFLPSKPPSLFASTGTVHVSLLCLFWCHLWDSDKNWGTQAEASLLYPHLTLQVQGRSVHPQGLSGALALLILFGGPWATRSQFVCFFFPQNELNFKSWGAKEVVSQGEPLSEISHQNHFSEGFKKIYNWFPLPLPSHPLPAFTPTC